MIRTAQCQSEPSYTQSFSDTVFDGYGVVASDAEMSASRSTVLCVVVVRCRSTSARGFAAKGAGDGRGRGAGAEDAGGCGCRWCWEGDDCGGGVAGWAAWREGAVAAEVWRRVVRRPLRDLSTTSTHTPQASNTFSLTLSSPRPVPLSTSLARTSIGLAPAISITAR